MIVPVNDDNSNLSEQPEFSRTGFRPRGSVPDRCSGILPYLFLMLRRFFHVLSKNLRRRKNGFV